MRVRCEDGCHASGAPGEYWITSRLAGIYLSLGSLHSRKRFLDMLLSSVRGTRATPADITDLEPEGGR